MINRCIKPNVHMAADDFDETMVKKQLKYNGISEICRIRKDGYPSRILVEDFVRRSANPNPKYACISLGLYNKGYSFA